MNHFVISLLVLLFSSSVPATKGNVEIWHSTLAAEAGDVSAATPIGRSGQPLNVATAGDIPANTPDTIAGRDYVGHALDSMQSRGIMPSIVENTIQQGVASPGNIAGRTVYFDSVNNVRVVTDSASGRGFTFTP